MTCRLPSLFLTHAVQQREDNVGVGLLQMCLQLSLDLFEAGS